MAATGIERGMEIVRGMENLGPAKPCAVTIGTFDGVHKGHLQIIDTLLNEAAQKKLCATLITFDPHPRRVIQVQGHQPVRLLTTIDEKLRLLKQTGLDRVLVIHFDTAFSQMDYKDFVKQLLIDKLDVRALVIGYDHAFGKDRKGHFASLEPLSKTYGFSLTKVEPFEMDGQIVNSAFIRQFLADGDVALAAELLGRPYGIKGRVVHGSDRGKTLRFPTANLEIGDAEKVIPGNGVYAVDVLYQTQRYKGMLNIGFKPTFGMLPSPTIEVHVIDFNKDIYGETLTVLFKKRLRNEIKFDSKEALIAQLEIDKQESLKI